MNLELLYRAKEYIEKLANGINPITNEIIQDESVFNDIKITRCLFFVKDVLEDNINKSKKQNKIPFTITREELKKYNLEEGTLTISKIVKAINDIKNNEYMKKLKVVDLTNWLVSIGLLEVKERNNKKIKLPTEEGIKMGMIVENRYGLYGNYSVVLYTKKMQEFIIDNFECFLEFIDGKIEQL